jgi:hypothetical protein
VTTYIAGPMTGYPDHNFPAFAAKAAELRAKGVEVLSPHEHGHTDHDYSWYIREDLKLLLQCDEVVLLHGWKDSKGATLEVAVAEACGMRIIEP